MNVLCIATLFPRHDNDVLNPWMIETVKRLRARGVEVTVYVPAWRGLGDHEHQGISVRRFRYFPKRWEILSHDETVPDQLRRNKLFAVPVAFYLLFGVLGLRRVLREKKYDLIHVHWPFPHGLFGWFAGRWAKAPVVSQFHGVELRWVSNKLPVFLPFLRRVLRTSALVIANSSHTRDDILKIHPCRVEIVPYGSPVREEADTQLPPEDPSRARRLLFVGRLVERKGVEYLVRALRHLEGLPWPVHLDIVGAGPLGESLGALADKLGLRERVHLAGRVANEDLKRYYSACDCFVLPAIIDSRGDTEGLGVVLVEALTFRRPVVASGVGGIVDVIKHERTGLLVPEKDPAALADAIRRVLTDRALAARLGGQGYVFVREYFDWDRIVGRTVELYREAMESWAAPVGSAGSGLKS